MYVFQVATPFSTGTGIYLPQYKLIVTNEHVVRDSASVVIGGEGAAEQLAPVIYLDPYYDLAFLRLQESNELPPLPLAAHLPGVGQTVTAMGQHFGEHRREATGRVVEDSFLRHGIAFFVHDARQGSTQSGSGAYGVGGELLGINMLDAPDDEGRTLALPATVLGKVLEDFTGGNGRPATRCFECRQLTFEGNGHTRGRCAHCGSELILPGQLEDAEPTGVNATIEAIIRAGGHDPRLARRGPNLWNIRQGSATIQIAYHEESGLVTGDAHLCQLPEAPSPDLFAYLLRENALTRQLSFSTYGRDIILSLLIYDRYLTVDTALPRFEYLFEQADAYDNILVERYGAGW
ncbi:serine protease Do [Neolewinella xylanilytica]|uniref:Serine protease Do n=1 Tax=Neolewinella xylanilytica TaxID=1514080 RepID=A0A2S6I441_9BACT|nr:trypsin-like peptidase domain-containing protein [Neolewinella xylanilytica]PPK85946.1 serine protease Do [Neolewinella xylanilytica]